MSHPMLVGDAGAKLASILGCAVALATLSIYPPFGARILVLAGGIFGASIVLYAAFFFGARLYRWVTAAEITDLDECAVSTAIVLGTGIFHGVVYSLAAIGLYHRYTGIALLLAGILLGGRAPWMLLKSLRYERHALLWVAAPAWCALLLAGGAPAIFWDSHSYHLAIPEIINATGSLPRGLSYIYGYYAIASECLFTLAWAFPFGEASAQVLNAAFMVMAIWAAAAPLSSEERPLARTILFCTPALVILAYLPKNSGLLALSTIVAFQHAMCDDGSEGIKQKSSRPLLAGLALGVALATHHAAMIAAPLILIFVMRTHGSRGVIKSLAAAVVVALPLYLRNMAVTGNPLYPFLGGLLGGESGARQLITPDPAIKTVSSLMEMAVAPWYLAEPLGVASTLGMAIPLGILIAIRDRAASRAELVRAAAGMILLGIGTLIFDRPRYGIGGLLLMVPLATRGLSRIPGTARFILVVQSLVAAMLLLTGPLRPLDAGFAVSMQDYRLRVVPTWQLAESATLLPSGVRIASVGILRPYGWAGRLEECSENMQPAIGEILDQVKSADGAINALRVRGFTHLAADFREMARLERGYGYLAFTPEQRAVLDEVIGKSTMIAEGRECVLVELPAAQFRP